MTKIAFEITQLLADGLAALFGTGAALLDQGQIVATRIPAIGAHLLHPRQGVAQQGVESIDNGFTDLAGLIEQGMRNNSVPFGCLC